MALPDKRCAKSPFVNVLEDIERAQPLACEFELHYQNAAFEQLAFANRLKPDSTTGKDKRKSSGIKCQLL